MLLNPPTSPKENSLEDFTIAVDSVNTYTIQFFVQNRFSVESVYPIEHVEEMLSEAAGFFVSKNHIKDITFDYEGRKKAAYKVTDYWSTLYGEMSSLINLRLKQKGKCSIYFWITDRI